MLFAGVICYTLALLICNIACHQVVTQHKDRRMYECAPMEMLLIYNVHVCACCVLSRV